MTDTERRPAGRFWTRRECWVPTWRTCVAVVILGIAATFGFMRGAHPFLAVTQPLSTDVLVVEGWCDDFVLESALIEFGRGHYSQLLVTGGPVEKGAPLSEYATYAEMGAATLKKLAPPGIPVVPVPAPRVDRDRTYSTAVALRRWFHARGTPPPRINLMTVAAHARRSRLLFGKALTKETGVGILAVTDPYYDPQRWWTSSYGVRTVISELIAYCYAATLFHPDPQPAVHMINGAPAR